VQGWSAEAVCSIHSGVGSAAGSGIGSAAGSGIGSAAGSGIGSAAGPVSALPPDVRRGYASP